MEFGQEREREEEEEEKGRGMPLVKGCWFYHREPSPLKATDPVANANLAANYRVFSGHGYHLR
jgi:hypothetical protein